MVNVIRIALKTKIGRTIPMKDRVLTYLANKDSRRSLVKGNLWDLHNLLTSLDGSTFFLHQNKTSRVLNTFCHSNNN